MNNIEVLERLADIVEISLGRKPYDKDIANALGMSPANYSNMKQKNRLPLEAIVTYCAKQRININWVLFEQSSKMLEEKTEAVFKIRFLENINGSAGAGAFNDDNDDFTFLSIDPIYKELLGIKETDKIEAIRIIGDSMEDTLSEGSIILIDRNKTELVNGGVFVINTTGGVLVKRISINPSGGIDLISDNKSYPVTTMPAEEIIVIGKVIGALEKI